GRSSPCRSWRWRCAPRRRSAPSTTTRPTTPMRHGPWTSNRLTPSAPWDHRPWATRTSCARVAGIPDPGGIPMKALQLTAFKRPGELVEVDQPEPGPGEVLLRIGGAGACHSDLHLMHDFEP